MKGLLVGLLLSAAAPHPWDWTQWRGPGRDATSHATPPGDPWPATLTQRWRSPAGSGQSSPVVASGTVFLFGREGEAEVPIRRYRVAESATLAHPVPTELGLLVRDESGLSLYAAGRP